MATLESYTLPSLANLDTKLGTPDAPDDGQRLVTFSEMAEKLRMINMFTSQPISFWDEMFATIATNFCLYNPYWLNNECDIAVPLGEMMGFFDEMLENEAVAQILPPNIVLPALNRMAEFCEGQTIQELKANGYVPVSKELTDNQLLTFMGLVDSILNKPFLPPAPRPPTNG